MELSVNGDRSVDAMLVAQAREQAAVATSGSAAERASARESHREGEKEHIGAPQIVSPFAKVVY